MSPIERYALYSGVKIENPQILEHFYPIPAAKYVCFCPSKKDALRDYDYWDTVLELVRPVLKRMGYSTVQIGTQKDDSIGCDIDLRGKLNIRQIAGVLRNCDFFVGADTFPTHVAAYMGKPIVAIYAASFLECSKPHWGDFSKHHLIQTPREPKENPSFLLNESPKTINRIKPEEIVFKIYEVLGINFDFKFKTLYVGPRFRDVCVDVIPMKVSAVQAKEMNIRMDFHHNDKCLQQILLNNQAEVTTKSPFNLNFPHVRNIKRVNYIASDFDLLFIESIKKLGIPMTLLCDSSENLSKERLKMFDYTVNFLDLPKLIAENKLKLGAPPWQVSIRSKKAVVCGENAYESLYKFSGKEDDFFVDLDWFYIYDTQYE